MKIRFLFSLKLIFSILLKLLNCKSQSFDKYIENNQKAIVSFQNQNVICYLSAEGRKNVLP